jgi:hypothetical protein
MSRFTLSLNSHALSSFQECENKYLFRDIIGLDTLSGKAAIRRGTVASKFLALYYYNRMKPRKNFQRVLANPLLWVKRIAKDMECSERDAFSLYASFIQYGNQYKFESWNPIAVEKGFSKILYEDSENLFVYEGRPDLIVTDTPGLIVVDHKTQSRKYSIYGHNNQAKGYLWATGGTQFVYNYINYIKVTEFRREAHLFTQSQIDDWVSCTTDWFFRIKHSITNMKFVPSWNCNSLYGVCPFHLICEQPKPGVREFVIKSQYKIRKSYRSW